MNPLQGDSGTTEDLAAQVAAIGYWYHKIALPGGIVTPGRAPIDPAAYLVPEDLTGKRVLDVGAWDGYCTFDALKRRAREVVAIDDFSDFLGSLETRTAWESFDLCRDALGYSDAQCQRHDMSIYDLAEARFGRFDCIFCFGVLYHLRHPLLALDTLAALCDEAIFIESATLDDYSPYRGGLGHGYGYAGGQMVIEFYPDSQYGNNDTNYWVPTLHCLGQMVRSAGFADVEGNKLTAQPHALTHCRGIVTGRRAPASQQ